MAFMAKDRRKSGPRSRPKRVREIPAGVAEHEPADPVSAAVEEEFWAKSRSGAISGRGFHFQDVVGAWLAARIYAGVDTVDALVPESFEDLCCEGKSDRFIQVKSRQERVGDFPIARAAEHILGVWDLHKQREEAGIGGQPLIIWERPVGGERFADWGDNLDHCLTDDHPLRAELRKRALIRGLMIDELDALLGSVSAFVLSWEDAFEQTILAVTSRTGVPRAAGVPIVQALRTAVADCVDRNAASNWSGRAALSRTEVERLVADVHQLIDRESLEQALSSGLCEPVDFSTALPGNDFFTGVDVQPGHVAAGLPVPRPEVTSGVLAALDDFRPVLVAGPSGVGKSAVMWMSAYVARSVLWYRVRRLEGQDVEPLIRLVRASGPSPKAPVGLVVDAVGTGAIEAWDQLLVELAAIPGALLLGSARNEDLLPIRTLPRCAVVNVALDEELAAKIYAGLTARQLTSALHWREAFENAHGLTLEYTHLLTKGRRLADVISEQVNRRIVDERGLEIDILGLASAAHQWGARLDVSALERHLGAPRDQFRLALQRLQDEHLIHVSHGSIDGLHQLRSRALYQAVHATPPPIVDETVKSVLGFLENTHLRSFVLGALSDQPDVDAALVDGLSSRMRQKPSVTVWTEVLEALRLADFRRRAANWREVLNRHNVRPADRLIAVQQVLVGGGIAAEMPELVKPEIGEAVRDILAQDEVESPLRDSLLNSIDSLTLTTVLLECTTPKQAALLIGATGGSAVSLAPQLARLNTGDSPLVRALETCTPAEVGELIKTAADANPPLGVTLCDLVGGQEALLRRFREFYPWLVDLHIDADDGDQVAVGRLLHVADEVQGSPDAYVRELARALLCCFPSCTRADVQAVVAGDAPITIRNYTAGVSGLLPRYVHTASSVAWARARLRSSASIVTDANLTNRVHNVIDLLTNAAAFLDDLLRIWCQSRGRQADVDRLNARRSALADAAADLTRPLDRAEQAIVDTSDGPAPSVLDDAHTLAQGIAENMPGRLASGDNHSSLAVYVRDTIVSAARAVARTERWELAGLDEAPAALGQIEDLLLDLHAVLAELVWGTLNAKAIQTAARGGPSQQALHRAADNARALAARRHDTQIHQLKAAGLAAGLNIEIYVKPVAKTTGVDWPPFEAALALSVEDIAEWFERLPVAVELVNQHLETSAYRPPVLLTPIIRGRPLRQLAQQLITELWPGQELFDQWATKFQPAWHTPLADVVAEAVAALQIMSGIALLPQETWSETHRSLLDRQIERFSANVALIPDEPPTDLREAIAELAARVEAELNSNQPSPDSLAGNLARAATGHPNEDFNVVLEMTLVALQRDIDRLDAVELEDDHLVVQRSHPASEESSPDDH
jgi:hypothetical protein